jgi:hypothetical protein
MRFAGLSALFALDVIHYLLQRTLSEIPAFIDASLHAAWNLSIFSTAIILPIAFCVVARRWQLYLLSRRATSVVAAVCLSLTLWLQFAHLALVASHTGSSSYHPLTSDYFVGPVIAILLLVATAQLPSRQFPQVIALSVSFLWLIAPLVVDITWATEGTERGASRLLQVPILGAVFEAATITVSVGLIPVALGVFVSGVLAVLEFARAPVKGGGRRTLTSQVVLESVSFGCLFLALALLATLLPEWSAFLMD